MTVSAICSHFSYKRNLMILPCPNLNPIERLWKVMNEHVRNNKYFATAKKFRKKLMSSLVKHFLRYVMSWRAELMIIFRF